MNLDKFYFYGDFGNADIYKLNDWKPIKEEDSYQNIYNREYITNNSTCLIYGNVNYKVYYSKMGFEANPQYYIVDIYKATTQDTW